MRPLGGLPGDMDPNLKHTNSVMITSGKDLGENMQVQVVVDTMVNKNNAKETRGEEKKWEFGRGGSSLESMGSRQKLVEEVLARFKAGEGRNGGSLSWVTESDGEMEESSGGD
ncbi:hypothetical protein H5410_050686 [Solanum commersonii]|uniref:Uncharacterized protein n=1 Tax=Solanum commersonii TaxID=4109 RepID=A0A9J5WW72_SOLCO|nr:hypothetical protein H5410_050686 [Solanum commersonii]